MSESDRPPIFKAPVYVMFTIPLQLKSRANLRPTNSVLAAILQVRSKKVEHSAGLWHTRNALLRAKISPAEILPCDVWICRISVGKLDDDNLAGSAKHLRDGIAHALGIDDGGRLARWHYQQRKPECQQGPVAIRQGVQVSIVRREMRGPPVRASGLP